MSQYAIYLCFYPDGVTPSVSAISGEPSGACFQGMSMGVLNIPPVGIATLGAGLWGQLDLAGEVEEWNLDLYATYANPCTDCVDATGGYYRVLRSGSFGDDKTNLVPSFRFENVSSTRNSNFGFRCARTP